MIKKEEKNFFEKETKTEDSAAKKILEPKEKDEFDVEDAPKKHILTKVALFFLELVKIAVLAGITIGFVRYFIFKPFYVEGQSMDPTFKEMEYLIIDEVTYRFKEPQRGEVIVFRAPINQKDFYLKRIIGLPGERIKIEDNKVIIYNNDHPQGIVIEEDYLGIDTPGSSTVTLGPDQYYVMGDNRVASFDSRRFGPISKNLIIGRTWLRGWPIQRVTLFSLPEYNL